MKRGGNKHPHELLVSVYIYISSLGEQFGIICQNEKCMNYLNLAKTILELRNIPVYIRALCLCVYTCVYSCKNVCMCVA